MSTLEERLRSYADTLDEITTARTAELPMRADAPVALLPGDVSSRRGGMRRVLAVGVVIAIVAAAVTIAVASGRHATTSPAPATVPKTTAITVPGGDDGLRPLFTRTTPDGIVITARVVQISPTETVDGCPWPPGASTRPVDCRKAPGVIFDYSVAGHEYWRCC
jgi:hypothetical protein